MRKLTVDNCISKEFNQSDYLEGKSDGLNGALNKNVGHFTPSLSYELGFNAGTKERLLSEINFYGDPDEYELNVTRKEPYPSWRMDVPATYQIEPKNCRGNIESTDS